ncbi:MAG: hypothetical protein ACE5I1_05255, partial [bacterium]
GEFDQVVMYSIVNEEPEPLADVPRHIGEIVAKCLAKDTEERYQSADELLSDLQQCRAELSGSEPVETVSVFQFSRERSKKKKWKLAGLSMAIFAFYRNQQDCDPKLRWRVEAERRIVRLQQIAR